MSTARLLASGLHFGEGPRWHDDVLWFSDFFDYAVKTVDLDGHVLRAPSAWPIDRAGSAGCPTGGCSSCR